MGEQEGSGGQGRIADERILLDQGDGVNVGADGIVQQHRKGAVGIVTGHIRSENEHTATGDVERIVALQGRIASQGGDHISWLEGEGIQTSAERESGVHIMDGTQLGVGCVVQDSSFGSE